MEITKELFDAYRTLISFAAIHRTDTGVGGSGVVSRAVDVLDNADFFKALTEAADEHGWWNA